MRHAERDESRQVMENVEPEAKKKQYLDLRWREKKNQASSGPDELHPRRTCVTSPPLGSDLISAPVR